MFVEFLFVDFCVWVARTGDSSDDEVADLLEVEDVEDDLEAERLKVLDRFCSARGLSNTIYVLLKTR